MIDPDWMPPLITPPFPGYTCGHSVQSVAAAQVMTDIHFCAAIDRGLEPGICAGRRVRTIC